MSALPLPTSSRFEHARAERAERTVRETSYLSVPDSADPSEPPALGSTGLQASPPPEPPESAPIMGVPQVQIAPQRGAGYEVKTGAPPMAPNQTRTGVIQDVTLPGMTPREQVINRDEAPWTAPVRRSLKKCMASAPYSFVDPTLMSMTDNPLTQADVGLTTMASTNAAFQIAADGEVTSAEAITPIATAVEVSEPAGVLDLGAACEYRLFFVSDTVDPAELRTLTISMWGEAGWIAPGRLRLSFDVELEGSWTLDQPMHAVLDTPASLSNAWILHCPQALTRQHNNGVMDEWDKAFPDGLPTDLEYHVLEALRRMARRLASGLRIMDSGHVMVPDADSVVNLTVYSPRWISPEGLLPAMRERAGFEQMKDMRDITPKAPKPAPLTPAQIAQIEKLKAELGPVRKGIASKIAKTHEEHEAQYDKPQIVDSYALMSPVGHHSDMMIEVRVVPTLPRTLRWEPWAAGATIEYQVRWLPTSTPTPGVDAIGRVARLECLCSTQDVEKATGMITTLVDGNIIDEDGFLVGLEEISPENGEQAIHRRWGCHPLR